MGAAIGNQYAANARRWRAAIDKALENRCRSDGQKALVKIAEQLLIKAEEGDITAIKEVGDRMDGRPQQTHDVTANITHNVTEVLLGDLTDDSDS